MNMNQFIDLIMRTVIRRAVNTGVNAGFDAVANMNRKSRTPDYDDEMIPTDQQKPKKTPEERERIRAMRQARRAARAANQSAKL